MARPVFAESDWAIFSQHGMPACLVPWQQTLSYLCTHVSLQATLSLSIVGDVLGWGVMKRSPPFTVMYS